MIKPFKFSSTSILSDINYSTYSHNLCLHLLLPLPLFFHLSLLPQTTPQSSTPQPLSTKSLSKHLWYPLLWILKNFILFCSFYMRILFPSPMNLKLLKTNNVDTYSLHSLPSLQWTDFQGSQWVVKTCMCFLPMPQWCRAASCLIMKDGPCHHSVCRSNKIACMALCCIEQGIIFYLAVLKNCIKAVS